MGSRLCRTVCDRVCNLYTPHWQTPSIFWISFIYAAKVELSNYSLKSLPCLVVLPISGSEQILPLNLVTAKRKKKLTAKVMLRIVETQISRESWPLTPASGSL